MSEEMKIALIGLLGVLLGAGISKFVDYLMYKKQQTFSGLKNKLAIAINDIEAFYEIEKKLTEQLAENSDRKTAEAIKKEIRGGLQRKPSLHSAPAEIRKMRDCLAAQ